MLPEPEGARMSETRAERREEFESHVWNHAEDVSQTAFDLRPSLSQSTIESLQDIMDLLHSGGTDKQLAARLREQIEEDPDYLFVVLQLVGLTREKPRSDLRVPLQQLGIATPSKIALFTSRPAVWKLAGPYLAHRVRSVFVNLLAVDSDALPGAFEAMNQATWPGYVRQERAKRSGGYAEQRIAILLRSLDIPFEPEKKADNGLTKDVTIAGQSFDIAIPNARDPKVCIMSMVHSANIGQYGESKASDAITAKKALAAMKSGVLLGVFADGVGFYSNIAGLNGLLDAADELFQFATLWKVGVVGAAVTSRKVRLVIPDPEAHSAFIARHRKSVTLLTTPDQAPGWVEAGEGFIRMA